MKTLLSLFGLVLVCAGAAPSLAASPQHPASNSADSAKAALAKLASLYAGAQSLSYTSVITIHSPSSTGPSSSEQVSVNGLIQRPNLVRLEVDKDAKMSGLIVSNGKETYAYDQATSRYMKTEEPDATASSITSELAEGGQLLGDPLGVAMFTPIMFTNPSPYDLSSVAPGKVSMSAYSEVLGGKPVWLVAEQVTSGSDSVEMRIYVDKATGLPHQVMEEVTREGKTFTPLSESFQTIQIGSSPLEASSFTWTPPAGATLFAPPSPADENKPALAQGTSAPDFSVQTVDGKAVHLSDYKGKVVVLDFWATWCGPCQQSLPHTDNIAKDYAPKGVVFLPICSWDEASAFQQWIGQHKQMSMSFYFDPAGKNGDDSIASKLYGVQGIPTQYVIGKDGKVVTGFVGYDAQSDPDETALQKALDGALAAS